MKSTSVLCSVLISGALGSLVSLFGQRDLILTMLFVASIVGFLVILVALSLVGSRIVYGVPPLLLVAGILFPPVRVTLIPDMRLEFIIVSAVWGAVLLTLLWRQDHFEFVGYLPHMWALVFGLDVLASTFYGTIFKGSELILRDFWEIAKLIAYFLILSLVSSLRLSPITIRRYFLVALLAFALSALVGFAQFLNIADINEVISPYYAPTQIRGLEVSGRVTGTTANPNEFGALMVLAFSLAFSGALVLKGKFTRSALLCLCGIFALAVALTLSRTALVSLIAATVTILFFRYPSFVGLRRAGRQMLIIIPALAIIVGIVVQLTPERFFPRAAQLFDITSATSWQARVENWDEHVQLWKGSPVLGWGPGKAIASTVVDNEWLLLLRRYGIVGVGIFITWFATYFVRLSQFRGAHQAEVQALAISLQATLIAYAIFMIPAAFYHSLQLMIVFVVLLGLAHSQFRSPALSAVHNS